jgi:hypothetical protein
MAKLMTILRECDVQKHNIKNEKPQNTCQNTTLGVTKMRLIICLVVIFTSLPALGGLDKGLQTQLIKMAQQSQQIRQNLETQAVANTPATLQSLAIEIDNVHSQTLKEIIALHGWPSKEKVGEKGIQAAFVLVKHSKNLAFQQDMLPLIIQSYLNNHAIAAEDVAQFTDNVSIKLGKKQVFGTQAELIDGNVVFAPIENADSVDLLRAQMGMSTLAEYKKTLETF